MAVYKHEVKQIDKRRRDGVARIIGWSYQRVGRPKPQVLFGGDFGEFIQMHTAIQALVKFQELNEYVGKNKFLKEQVLARPSKQPGASVAIDGACFPYVYGSPHMQPALAKWGGRIAASNVLRQDEQSRRRWFSVEDQVYSLGQFGSVVLVLLNPVVKTIARADGTRQLHCDNGPAVIWENGTEEYWLRGVDVPKTFVLKPERIKVSTILKQLNQEVRRVMIDIFGRERFIKEAEFEPVHKDEYGTLMMTKASFPAGPSWDTENVQDGEGQWVNRRRMEKIAMVEVTNGTPEADGTRKKYFLQVPPESTTALEAVAWGYNMSPEQYKQLQTRT